MRAEAQDGAASIIRRILAYKTVEVATLAPPLTLPSPRLRGEEADHLSFSRSPIAAWAAARRAMGTR